MASLAASPDRARSRRRAVWEALLVGVGLTVFVCVITWPLVSGLGDIVAGEEGQDATGGVWFFWALHQEGGYHVLGSTHHTLTGAPVGWVEGNAVNLQWLLPNYPAYLLTPLIGEIAAFNVMVLAGYVLSGAAMYALVRYLRCHPAVAAWAALVYVVFPWHLERIQHLTLVHLEVFPVLVITLVAAARRPDWLRFLLVGLATLACWLTSGYYGVIALAAAITFAAVAALAAKSRGDRLRLVAGPALAAVVASGLVRVVASFGDVGATVERLERNLFDLDAYGLRVSELVVPAAHNLVLGGRLEPFLEKRLHASNVTETTNYVGLLTLALAVAWLVVAWRRRAVLPERVRAATLGLPAVIAVALLFALPSPFLGIESTPSRVLFDHVSTALRVPSRWIVLVVTALVPLAALALQAAWAALDRRGRRAAAYGVVGAAAAVSFLELFVVPMRSYYRPGPLPGPYRALERTPAGVLADYPLRRSDIYQFWQRLHGRPMVNIDRVDSLPDDIMRALVHPGAQGTASQLSTLGVTAIVTRPDTLSYADPTRPPERRAQWGPGYGLVQRFPDGTSVWRVTAAPAPAVASLPMAEFGFPSSPRGSFVGYAMDSSTAHIDLLSKTDQVVLLRFTSATQGTRGRTLHVTGASGEVSAALGPSVDIATTVRVPAGRSRVAVSVEPQDVSDANAVELSAPWTQAAPGEEPALVAEPLPGP
jgi:hypothetical protein